MTTSTDRANDASSDPDAPSDEVARIVIRAGQRGFSQWRVATALGVSLRGLAAIQALAGDER